MFSRLNFEVLIQIIIEVFFALAISLGLITGKINLIVHPKFNVFLWISVVFLIAMAIFSAFNLFKAKHMNIFTKYFMLLIPLLLCMVISIKDLNNAGTVYTAGISGGVNNGISDSKAVLNNPPPSNTLSIQKMESDKEKYRKKKGEDYIDIDDQTFLKWYYEMTFKWDDFEGEKFKFLATVFKPDNNSDFVVLGRLGMVCCMADMQPCGFIYNGKGYKDLKNGQWIWVTGKIKQNKKYTYNYEQLPMIYDIQTEKARKPIDEYVYIN